MDVQLGIVNLPFLAEEFYEFNEVALIDFAVSRLKHDVHQHIVFTLRNNKSNSSR